MPTFLTLPPEIRNAIYADIFIPPVNDPIPIVPAIASPLATALLLDPRDHPPQCSPSSLSRSNSKSNRKDTNEDDCKTTTSRRRSSHLDALLTCRQIHREVQLLALSTSIFHLHSTSALPEQFALQAHPLTPEKLGALKHLTLTARITQLRALNETWNGKPFGNNSLQLDTLTILPLRPDAGYTAWAEVAELNQSHTLSHVLAETLKTLRGVKEVRVMNMGCFGDGVWPLVYRHAVVKIWTWGGANCGIRFEAGGEGEKGWFRAFLGQLDDDGDEGGDGGSGRGEDAAVEAHRLLGVAGTNPNVVAGTPLT